MSDYNTYAVQALAQTLENDIAKALKPKPSKIHEDYWVIYERDMPTSYHSYDIWRSYDTKEKAIAMLQVCESVEIATPELSRQYFPNEEIVYADKHKTMSGTEPNERLPVLYAIRHCVFDTYPTGMDILDLSDEAIELLKNAYATIRQAEIYTRMVMRIIEDGCSDSDARSYLTKKLNKLTNELRDKDWSEAIAEEQQD